MQAYKTTRASRAKENMSLEEIAAVLNVSKQTVSSTLAKALQKLRVELERRGVYKEELRHFFHLEEDETVEVLPL